MRFAGVHLKWKRYIICFVVFCAAAHAYFPKTLPDLLCELTQNSIPFYQEQLYSEPAVEVIWKALQQRQAAFLTGEQICGLFFYALQESPDADRVTEIFSFLLSLPEIASLPQDKLFDVLRGNGCIHNLLGLCDLPQFSRLSSEQIETLLLQALLCPYRDVRLQQWIETLATAPSAQRLNADSWHRIIAHLPADATAQENLRKALCCFSQFGIFLSLPSSMGEEERDAREFSQSLSDLNPAAMRQGSPWIVFPLSNEKGSECIQEVLRQRIALQKKLKFGVHLGVSCLENLQFVSVDPTVNFILTVDPSPHVLYFWLLVGACIRMADTPEQFCSLLQTYCPSPFLPEHRHILSRLQNSLDDPSCWLFRGQHATHGAFLRIQYLFRTHRVAHVLATLQSSEVFCHIKRCLDHFHALCTVIYASNALQWILRGPDGEAQLRNAYKNLRAVSCPEAPLITSHPRRGLVQTISYDWDLETPVQILDLLRN